MAAVFLIFAFVFLFAFKTKKYVKYAKEDNILCVRSKCRGELSAGTYQLAQKSGGVGLKKTITEGKLIMLIYANETH